MARRGGGAARYKLATQHSNKTCLGTSEIADHVYADGRVACRHCGRIVRTRLITGDLRVVGYHRKLAA